MGEGRRFRGEGYRIGEVPFEASIAAGADSSVGKRTLVDALPDAVVQHKLEAGPAASTSATTVRAAAAHGTSGSAGPLPHLSRIQR